MNRKKRLEKGIESIAEEIRIHEEKLKAAEAAGEEELVRYYHKDIARLKKQKEQKEDKFGKQ
jgi:phage shock protein A